MSRNSGFSLVEVLVAVAILGLIMGAIYTLFQTSNRTYVVQNHVVAMQQDARFGIDHLGDHLRMAGYDPRGVGVNTFSFQLNAAWDGNSQTCNATNMAFTADDDQDGTVDANDAERVAFRFQGGELQRYRNGSGWETVVAGVDTTASAFIYWYADGNSSAASGLPNDTDGPTNNDSEKIREVQMALVMNPPDLYGKTLQAKSYSTWVKCRNMAIK